MINRLGYVQNFSMQKAIVHILLQSMGVMVFGDLEKHPRRHHNGRSKLITDNLKMELLSIQRWNVFQCLQGWREGYKVCVTYSN